MEGVRKALDAERLTDGQGPRGRVMGEPSTSRIVEVRSYGACEAASMKSGVSLREVGRISPPSSKFSRAVAGTDGFEKLHSIPSVIPRAMIPKWWRPQAHSSLVRRLRRARVVLVVLV